MNATRRPISERRELFAAKTVEECEQWQGFDKTRHSIEFDEGTGISSVYNARKPKREPVINRPIRRLTRETFRVNGVTKERNRPLWVSLEPGDVISFCPRGTSQRVSVPVASLYNFARFTAARAIANAKRAARKAKKKS
jgi:hypothetical protein